MPYKVGFKLDNGEMMWLKQTYASKSYAEKIMVKEYARLCAEGTKIRLPYVREVKDAPKPVARKPARAGNSNYTKGAWYFYNSYCLNFTPEYRFAKVIKKIGTPYYDNGIKRQKVMIELYGYKRVGSSCVPYVSDTNYYMPTEKVMSKEGELLYYDDGTTRLKIGSRYLEQWDGKKAGEVVCRYSPYD